MGLQTGIEWTDATWNPWQGCTKVSPACANCYMFRDLKRYGRDPTLVTRSRPPTFNLPLKRKRTGEYAIPAGAKIFTCSYSDWFHEEADEWRPEAWEIIRQRPDVVFQIVTKRPERIRDHLPEDWGDGWPNVWLIVTVENQEWANRRIDYLMDVPAVVRGLSIEPLLGPIELMDWGPIKAVRSEQPKSWAEFTWPEWVPAQERKYISEFWAESYSRSPAEWDRDNAIQHTPKTGEIVGVTKAKGIGWVCHKESPQAVEVGRWLHRWNNMGCVVTEDGRTICAASSSGPYWLGKWRDYDGSYRSKIDWVIVGGESGPGVRPMHPAWVQSIRDQCLAQKIPFFFKQWGEWAPSTAQPVRGKYTGGGIFLKSTGAYGCQGDWWDGNAVAMDRVGKHAAGRQLDGKEWSQFPNVKVTR